MATDGESEERKENQSDHRSILRQTNLEAEHTGKLRIQESIPFFTHMCSWKVYDKPLVCRHWKFILKGNYTVEFYAIVILKEVLLYEIMQEFLRNNFNWKANCITMFPFVFEMCNSLTCIWKSTHRRGLQKCRQIY